MSTKSRERNREKIPKKIVIIFEEHGEKFCCKNGGNLKTKSI